MWQHGQSKNLLNSRREEYSACNCRTWFLWLRYCENEGTEEAVGSQNSYIVFGGGKRISSGHV